MTDQIRPPPQYFLAAMFTVALLVAAVVWLLYTPH
jgi:hypothetical protein